MLRVSFKIKVNRPMSAIKSTNGILIMALLHTNEKYQTHGKQITDLL